MNEIVNLFREGIDLDSVDRSGEDQRFGGGSVILADLFANRKRLQPLKKIDSNF